ncbi:MAG: DUF1415 domain-containing protein [Burkholderiales bacterium]
MSTPATPTEEQVVAATRAWLERAVIGLNLCPFAKAVHVKGQIRYVVSQAGTPAELLTELKQELRHLVDADPAVCDTTLLIHPHVLADFLDYNDFLDDADAAVEELELDGVLQVASFHPQYQFDGTDADDVTNYSNRSPFPTLHLLREESIDRAVEAFPDAERIYETNIETLRRLGVDGWCRINAAAD